MDAVTYPDEMVVAFVQDNFVPLLIPYNAKPLSEEFNIKWTPTLITLGFDRREHHRTVGFLAPDAFIASALLGIGKYHFDNDRFSKALGFLEKIITAHPQSDFVAEAIYLQGVARYKKSREPMHLKEAYEILHSKYPDGEWTRKAYPYRLL